MSMANRELAVTVTMDEHDWLLLEQAADCAGMTVPAYISWNARLLAQQARPGAGAARRRLPARARRARRVADETEEQAWAQSFSERLTRRTDLYRDEPYR
ncbi:hypothetical protein [Nocardia noduli]|uniref:hypothetical protein n=1 Tax=Nocardia noduli TaxID=2815722 RepID=UPI001C22057F|nr:hypothetical protein [Nocardia noduli]